MSPPPQRLLSLDAYRGAIMLLLVSHGFGLSALAHSPAWAWVAAQLQHAEWAGCTFWDLIQPAFTFIVGAALPLALASRRAAGTSPARQARHALYRALRLILLSNILSNFNSDTAPVFQLINVLCQIAFGYLICFFIIHLRFRLQIAAGALLLLGHWALFLLFPAPAGPFAPLGNVGARLDYALFGYNYPGYYVTLNFLSNAVTILFGCWAGMLVSSARQPAAKLRGLALWGLASIAAGWALTPVNPMVKRLWTASFTLASAGWVLLGLALFYWIIEIRGWRRWSFPAVVAGTNCIFLYAFWQVLSEWLDHGIGVFSGRFAWLGHTAPIAQTWAVTAALWGLCYWLYRRKIFFKL
jgi:predicted acyltransferase